MNILEVAQTLFYFTVSFAIILIAIKIIVIGFLMINIMRKISKVFDEISEASEEIHDRLEEVLDSLHALPIFSFFIKKAVKKAKENLSKKVAKAKTSKKK